MTKRRQSINATCVNTRIKIKVKCRNTKKNFMVAYFLKGNSFVTVVITFVLINGSWRDMWKVSMKRIPQNVTIAISSLKMHTSSKYIWIDINLALLALYEYVSSQKTLKFVRCFDIFISTHEYFRKHNETEDQGIMLLRGVLA